MKKGKKEGAVGLAVAQLKSKKGRTENQRQRKIVRLVVKKWQGEKSRREGLFVFFVAYIPDLVWDTSKNTMNE